MKMPQDRYIKVGTINTRYWAAGSQGSPVILIHDSPEKRVAFSHLMRVWYNSATLR